MGNYLVGVTGLEPEIAGYDEREVVSTVSCEATDETGSVCGYDGTAVVTETLLGSTVTTRWTCPFCGAENSDTYDLSEVGL